ncbi:MAG: hypothetical protein IPP72_18965 [Chitinophagaceae bacterium]|nr:hypothetical protein [Chitinophagaceae bacterium]
MKAIKFPILLVTLFAVLYNSLPFFGVNQQLITALFAIAPFATLWMVYRILKDGIPTNKTWENHFYEDYDYKRNGKEDAGELQ